jgi:arylsulfatase A-like enzyme
MASRPNVIVFFTDQQRHDCSGLHGNPLDLMPNFDAMARSGTHVAESFTCQPVCGPARSCLQTGLYATKSGCWRNGIPLPDDSKTLAHHFRAGGYSTGYIGKWHLAKEEPVTEHKRGGYQYWLASNVLEFTSEEYHTVMYDNENKAVTLPGYRVDACTDAAIRYIDSKQKEPFFLFLSFIEPHFQNHRDDYPAPAGYEERYRSRWIPPDLAALGGSTHQHLAGYYGMVKRLDEALGRLLDALRSMNLYDNTVVLFTSDHACHFKTRNSEYKRSCHESSIRVPTAFHGGPFMGGGQIQKPVSLIDLPPTLLDAAGLPVPKEMQGRSIMPLVRHSATDWPEEVFVQISEAQTARAVRTKRWKYCVAANDKNAWSDSGSDRYSEDALYDLYSDPYELRNLITEESHRETAEVMRERLLRRMVEAGESKPVIQPAERKPSGQRRVSSAEARQ